MAAFEDARDHPAPDPLEPAEPTAEREPPMTFTSLTADQVRARQDSRPWLYSIAKALAAVLFLGFSILIGWSMTPAMFVVAGLELLAVGWLVRSIMGWLRGRP